MITDAISKNTSASNTTPLTNASLNRYLKPLALKWLIATAGTIGMVASMISVPNIAQANNPFPALKADAPNRYVVKKGDTLWEISGKFLKSPWRWKEIWATNRQIHNPDLIYPNDVLIMCVIKGHTLVGVDTGEGCAGVEKAMSSHPTPTSSTTLFVAGSVPTIPLSAIEAWLDRTIIVSPNDYDTTPYVIASKNKNLITGQGNKIYAKGTPLKVGQRYGIYAKGEPYINPTNHQMMGLEVTQVASGVVTDVANNGVSSIELQRSYGREVRESDHVFIEMGNNLPPVFYPQPAQVSRGGKIIRVMGSLSHAAKGSVVAINLGSNQGTKPGDVLISYQKGVLVRDDYVMNKAKGEAVRLPSEQTGMIMVFKTFDNISYAYVLEAEALLNVNDLLLPPTEN